MKIAEAGKSHNMYSRHMNIRYFFIKDRIERGDIKLKYVETKKLVADIMTKPLQGTRFRKQRTRLMNHDLDTAVSQG